MEIDLKFKLTFVSNGVGWNDGKGVTKTVIADDERRETIESWAGILLGLTTIRSINWYYDWIEPTTGQIHLRDFNWNSKERPPSAICNVQPVLLLAGQLFRLEEIHDV
jgi:hypothetical protein